MSRSLEVVIVDDEEQITDLLETFIRFTSSSINIHTFNDSARARDFLLEHRPDVVITDYKMPDVNGIELLEILGDDVKKILISGYVSEIAVEKLEKMDATFFEKPVPINELKKIIVDLEMNLAS